MKSKCSLVPLMQRMHCLCLKKGRLEAGCDADIVLLDDEMEIQSVFALGKLMVEEKKHTFTPKFLFLLSMFTPVPTILMVIIAGIFGVVMFKTGRFEA